MIEPPPVFLMWGKAAKESSQNGTNIHVEGLVPLFFCNLLGASGVQYSRVVQQKIQSAELSHGLIEEGFNIHRSGNVGWNREGKIANFVSNLLDAIPSPADQRHLRSFP